MDAPPSAPITTMRWLGAAAIGVVVSVVVLVASSLALAMAPPHFTYYAALGGLLVGAFAAGRLVQAKTVRRWAAAAGLVLVAEVLLYVVVMAILIWYVDAFPGLFEAMRQGPRVSRW